jgi:hypothetical protein
MEKVQGAKLKVFPPGHLTRVADLIYYDGPLLSLYKNPLNDRYLSYWCDLEDGLNRWLFFRVSEKRLNSYLEKEITLRDLILGPVEGTLLCVDVDADDRFTSILLLTPEDLPSVYIPKPNTYYDFTPVVAETSETENGNGYELQIAGSWDLEDLSEFPHTYSQAYSFLYSLEKFIEGKGSILEHAYQSHPWTGGYSAVNFYQNLKSYIPQQEYPQIVSIQYSSPGYIKLSLYEPVAFLIKNTITAFAASYGELEFIYRRTYKYLGDRKLLRDAKEHPELTKEDLAFISGATKDLAALMRLEQFSRLDELTHDPLITLKILLWFYRRAKTLTQYKMREKAEY